jgi:molybdate transport system ATP-binding protein
MSGQAVLAPGALQVHIEQAAPMPLHGALVCQPGELLALVGPSGAGKTSLLRVLAGLMRPAWARITVGDAVWTDTAAGICLPPQARHVGLVFQNYALMPHLSAIDNVALSLLHLPRRQREEQARQWLDRMRLSGPQQTRRPAQLSGGQQQRVALARALARAPRLLLLDEPFSSVDQMNRQGLYDLLAELRQSLCIPMVMVTHDLQEARQLADSLVVMDAGQVLQQGSPARIYRSPRNARVADLVGVQNRFQGRWLGPQTPEDRAAQLGWLQWLGPTGAGTEVRLRVRDKGRLKAGQDVTWVIQGDGILLEAEAVVPSPADALGQAVLQASVAAVRQLGETTLISLALYDVPGVQLRLMRSGPLCRALALQQPLTVRLVCDWVHVMPIRSS